MEVGVDIIVLSNMMDGFVVEICCGFDEVGYYNILIMSYGVKYVFSFFGFFRDVVDLVLLFGDRKMY